MKHIAHCTVIFLGFGVVSDIEDTILWYLYFCGKSNGLTELLKICKKYIYIYKRWVLQGCVCYPSLVFLLH